MNLEARLLCSHRAIGMKDCVQELVGLVNYQKDAIASKALIDNWTSAMVLVVTPNEPGEFVQVDISSGEDNSDTFAADVEPAGQ